MDVPWILISIAIGIVVLLILGIFVLTKKDWKREVDYRMYFNMGIIWLPLGIVFYLLFGSMIGLWFIFMGIVYLSIGMKNKDKWGKPQHVSPTYQKILMTAVAVGVILLILGIIVYELIV